HDRYFLNKVAQSYWFIHDGQMEKIIGTFEDYESYKKSLDKNKSTLKQQSKSSTTVRKKNGLSYKEKLEYEQLMKRIEQAEVRMEEIDVLMIEASADYGKIKELNEEKEQLEIQYDLDITRWSELEEIKEQQ
ncbi:TPA: ABC transporter ATP-binding protein, partial [Staphylococcus aureus]|nr:ABC transporter ATP-binding protein [Staphylococcus aureus]